MDTSEIDLTINIGGEPTSVFEIMQRYRSEGSCEYAVRDALVAFAKTQTARAPLGRAFMDEVRYYNDGNGCTRQELVDRLLVAVSQGAA